MPSSRLNDANYFKKLKSLEIIPLLESFCHFLSCYVEFLVKQLTADALEREGESRDNTSNARRRVEMEIFLSG